MFEPKKFGNQKSAQDSIDSNIRSYDARDIRTPGPLAYQTPTIASRATAEATPERPSSSVRDRRFQIDPLLKKMVAIDEETERRIQVEVEERVAKIQQEAFDDAQQEGFKQGYAVGRQESTDKYQADARERIEQIDAFLANVEATKSEMVEFHEKFILELAHRIAAQVIRGEISQNNRVFPEMVRGIVEEVGLRESLKIWVHPERLTEMELIVPGIEKKFSTLKNVTVEAHPELGALDCVVDTDFSRVDASIDTQLARLHERLHLDSKPQGQPDDRSDENA